MNTYKTTWTTDGNDRKGFVAFMDNGNVVGIVNIYAVYENPIVSVIGVEHNGENLYESAWAGGIDGAKGELTEKAVAFYEGYSMENYEQEVA